MYSIEKIPGKENNYLKIKDVKNNSSALISLKLGGSLQELLLNNKTIISKLNTETTKKMYASSILFPFVGRIKNGVYKFRQKSYQLKINDKESNNALHGLIYDKEFKIKSQKITKSYAQVTLIYNEVKKQKGFPYIYNIELTYILYSNSIVLNVKITNNDVLSFPYTIGWHPYFFSSNLHKSHLQFNSKECIIFDEQKIPFNIKKKKTTGFQIKHKVLDNAYLLQDNIIDFSTPDYQITIDSSSHKGSYLQIYTPPNRKSIAIEPISGPSNGLNNKIGLQILNPKEEYTVNWKIELNTN